MSHREQCRVSLLPNVSSSYADLRPALSEQVNSGVIAFVKQPELLQKNEVLPRSMDDIGRERLKSEALFVCSGCHKKYKGPELIWIHHKLPVCQGGNDYISSNPINSNLMPVCKSCHETLDDDALDSGFIFYDIPLAIAPLAWIYSDRKYFASLFRMEQTVVHLPDDYYKN